MKKIKLLVCVLDRGKGESLIKHSETGFGFIMLGTGTAQSDLLDYLGIGETEKDIVITTVSEAEEQECLKKLTDVFELKKTGKGIAFTVSINSVGGPSQLEILSKGVL